MESTKTSHRAGLYLPTVEALKRQMDESQPVPLPDGAGVFGPQRKRKFIEHDELRPLARRVKAFLKRDVVDNFNKHLSKNGGAELLAICSYMDPRFKSLHFLDDGARGKAKTQARSMLLSMVCDQRDPRLFPAAKTEAAAIAELKAQTALQALQAAKEAAEAAGDITIVESCGIHLAKPKAKGRGRGKGKGSSSRAQGSSVPLQAPPVRNIVAAVAEDEDVPGFSLRQVYQPGKPKEPSANG